MIGQGANDLYVVDLAERLSPRGVTVLATNPGMVDTDIRNGVTGSRWLRIGMRVVETIARPFMVDPATYAERLDELITRPSSRLDSPLYGPRFGPIRVRPAVSDPERRAELRARSLDLLPAVPSDGSTQGPAPPRPPSTGSRPES